jgi:hypothetical protein
MEVIVAMFVAIAIEQLVQILYYKRGIDNA